MCRAGYREERPWPHCAGAHACLCPTLAKSLAPPNQACLVVPTYHYFRAQAILTFIPLEHCLGGLRKKDGGKVKTVLVTCTLVTSSSAY